MFYFGLFIFLVYLAFKFLYLYVPFGRKQNFESGSEKTIVHSFAVIVPAFNEKKTILNCIRSLTGIDYPDHKVYIIDDGSTDGTVKIIDRFLSLRPVSLREDGCFSHAPITGKYRSSIFPNIYLIRKENGGKADALNAGLACCGEDIVITLDADCIMRPDSITTMNRAFQNKRVAAAGGTVHITQSAGKTDTGCIGFRVKNIIRYQIVQYLTAFCLHKYTQSFFGSLIVISGAYGAFRRDILAELNGYRASVGEDMDVTLRIHSFIKENGGRYIMVYVPESVCFTECPESFKSLTSQRIRWQKAFIDCLAHHGPKMFIKFKPGISCFFLLDSFLLGTLTTLLFFAIPLFVILHGGISPVLIFLLSFDYISAVIEAFASLSAANSRGFSIVPEDKGSVALFIIFGMYLYRFMNLIFVAAGTICYFFGRRVWNRAERLGRSLAAEQTARGAMHEGTFKDISKAVLDR
jgi:cellulose synthase/poly-beta-1,6-N-acetylglucosamine synthase-like glycosyltransferase